MLEDQKPDQQPSNRFDEFFDKIKDMFKEGIETKGIKEEPKITPMEFKGFHIDLPRKQKDMYHGSSYEILCNKPKTWCKIKGDLVTEEDYGYEVVKVLEDSDCKIFSTHTHVNELGKFPYTESHLHFICQDRDRIDTIKMINFLKDY
jgi:hypothetical protein